MTMDRQELRATLEAIIYVADEPATVDQMARATGAEKSEVRAALDELVAYYQSDERGFEIKKVAGGYRLATKVQHHDALRRFIKSLQPPVRLTMAALETLAVVAYKQPVTLPEINEIRGVNCAGVIQTLLDRKLVTTAGRKAVVGRPILYRTSKDFLLRFGLDDVADLPSLKEFEQLARAALGSDEGIAPMEVDAAVQANEAPTDRVGDEPAGGHEVAEEGSPDSDRAKAEGSSS